jgi:hypothetical protein
LSSGNFTATRGELWKAARTSNDGHCKYIDTISPLRSIDISQQGHKAEIHVQLLVAMHKLLLAFHLSGEQLLSGCRRLIPIGRRVMAEAPHIRCEG